MPELEAPTPLPARKKLPWWQPWFVVILAVVVVKLIGVVGAVLCVGAFFLVERRYGPVKGAGASVLVAAAVGFVVLNGVAPKSMLPQVAPNGAVVTNKNQIRDAISQPAKPPEDEWWKKNATPIN